MRPQGAILACIVQLMIACSPGTGRSTAEAPFLGTWDLVSITTQWPDGRETTPWGTTPIGGLSYGVDGRMTAVLMDAARNQASGRAVSPEHQANVASYHGGFAIDTARRVVRHRVAASMRAAASGILERAYAVQGDCEWRMEVSSPVVFTPPSPIPVVASASAAAIVDDRLRLNAIR